MMGGKFDLYLQQKHGWPNEHSFAASGAQDTKRWKQMPPVNDAQTFVLTAWISWACRIDNETIDGTDLNGLAVQFPKSTALVNARIQIECYSVATCSPISIYSMDSVVISAERLCLINIGYDVGYANFTVQLVNRQFKYFNINVLSS